ncbi:MAG: DUF368 domain-containing protein, partial [Pisciglobus halotolerans]|nr:DUF368 domain-containing protein [Pisciglobus halotolerans]
LANIIPGVSGGTMAVSLGIYDKLIYSITHLFKDWKSSLRFLMPLLIGAGLGIVGFTYIIEFLLANYTLTTALAFIGLILGGLPILFRSFVKSLKEEKRHISFMHILPFLFFFAIAVGLPMLQASGETLMTFQLTASHLIQLFFVGVIAAATMVIPGVSGSLVLIILGYYYGILNTITLFLAALKAGDKAVLGQQFSLLVIFGIGVLMGIFLISKVIEFLFNHYSSYTYAGILGLVIASPIAILYNTHALLDLYSPNAWMYAIVGILLLAVGYIVTYKLGEKS